MGKRGIMQTGSISGAELNAKTSTNRVKFEGNIATIDTSISGYYLPSTGGASNLKVHISGDDNTIWRTITVATATEWGALPDIDKIDMTGVTAEASLLLFVE